MTYNPKSPRYLGLEWPVNRTLAKRVARSGTALCEMFASSVSEDLASIELPAQAAKIHGSLKLGVDVYSCGLDAFGRPTGVVPGVAYGVLFNPTVDTGSDYTSTTVGGAAWVTQAGAAATFAVIDDGATVDLTDYLKNVNATDDCHALTRVASLGYDSIRGFVLPYNVYVEITVGCTTAAAPRLNACLDISGVRYYGPDVYVDPALGVQTLILNNWYTNPATGLPWSPDAYNALFLNCVDEWGIRARFDNEAADKIRIYRMRLGFQWVGDLRVAYGSLDLDETLNGTVLTVPLKSRPNLIETQNSGLENAGAGVADWVAETNCAVTRSTTVADTGSASLRLSSSAGGDMSATNANWMLGGGASMLIQGPRSYVFRARVRAGTNARTCRLEVIVDGVATVGTGVADSNAAWTTLTCTVAMTSGMHTVSLRVKVLATGGAGELHYFDTMMVSYDENPTASTVGGGEVSQHRKSSTTSYLYVLRRISGNGSINFTELIADGVACPHISHKAFNLAVADASGRLSTTIYSADDGALPIVLRTTGPATSADSQPYGLLDTHAVANANTQQEFTPPGTASYSAVGLVLASTLDTDAALTVSIRRRSDNVAVATATVNRSDLDATPEELQWVVVSFAAAVSLTAQQYYVDVPLAGGWQQGRVQRGVLTDGDTATFGGTTDIASSVNDTVAATGADYPFVVRPAIPTPGLLTVTRVDA